MRGGLPARRRESVEAGGAPNVVNGGAFETAAGVVSWDSGPLSSTRGVAISGRSKLGQPASFVIETGAAGA